MACFKFGEIPENANFIAQQPDGEWWWYEKEPIAIEDGKTGTGWRPTAGFCGRLYLEVDEWKQTLSAL